MKVPWHLDFESRSRCNLKTRGAYRYASDSSTEILMLAIARGSEEPALWINPKWRKCVPGLHDPRADRLLEEMEAEGDPIIYAHNAQFEMAMTKYRWAKDVGTRPPVPRNWRCTAAMARSAALPSSLLGVGEALNLGQQKDKAGGKLIDLFCTPNKIKKADQVIYGTEPRFIDPPERPEEFRQFGAYCLQDVRTEQQVHHGLIKFEFTGPLEQIFVCDSVINDRGIPINVKALLFARRIVQEAEAELASEFRRITGLNHTQNDKYKTWLKEFGYPHDDLQANTVDEAVEGFEAWIDIDVTNIDETMEPPSGAEVEAMEALVLRSLRLLQKLSFAAVKKIDAMLGCDCGDGYVRGTLKFWGAGTGRWSASLIQPQNFKRATFKDTAGAYKMICSGCSREELEMMYGDAIEVVASCIRHFLQPPFGAGFLDADYAAIEARIVCWLAGQHDALDEYRKKLDRYVLMAMDIYQKREKDITKEERWVGKQSVLGCGFSMWIDAFVAQCAKYGVTVPYETAEKAVLAWRARNAKVVQLWADFEMAARSAIRSPGRWFAAGPKCKFGVTKFAGIVFLVLRLPSGRNIVYPHPKIEYVNGGKRKREQITFWGQIPGKSIWGRLSTYGGKLVENATQGTAFDIMANGTVKAEAIGYETVMLVHDQGIANDNHPLGIEGYIEALCDLPEWADGLPIDAEGSVAPYYRKD